MPGVLAVSGATEGGGGVAAPSLLDSQPFVLLAVLLAWAPPRVGVPWHPGLLFPESESSADCISQVALASVMVSLRIWFVTMLATEMAMHQKKH